jgi:hypothetical protein
MRKLLSKKLIIVYLLLVVAIRFIFQHITQEVLIAPFPSIIDMQASKFFHVPPCTSCLFDSAYVSAAKHGGYNISNYLKMYLPLDTLFPLIYTLGLLSIMQLLPKFARGFKTWMTVTILAGAVLDYLENFTFATYLKTDNESLANAVSFFTTFKTFFTSFNLIVSMVIIILYFVRRKAWEEKDAKFAVVN